MTCSGTIDVRIGVGCCLQSVAVMGFYDRYLERTGKLGSDYADRDRSQMAIAITVCPVAA
ncbi:MAG: hypothetical protein AAGM36_04120 [Cyanobacteria bacterium J06597_1]